MTRRLLVGLIFAALATAGCSDLGEPVTAPAPEETLSFQADVQPIFDGNCVGCHGAGGNGGLDLRAGQSHAALVGATSPTYGAVRVVAGDPDASVLFDKLSGGGTYGQTMPPTGTSLPPAALETIRAWIAAGAPDN
ncbi:c-type cytochrome [bacterium]|nr:c-type cytochrome [bacterium]HPF35730.1 c-type cytochrome [Candidatus Krumholzibacteria bacterium]HRX52214.1 c-type cytochrome [Candidatus Krumholzibacteria bacterium]